MMELARDNYLKANSIYTYLIAFISSAVSIVFNIYSSTLFLSYYPATWLPYQMLASALLTISVSIVLSKFLVSNVKKNAQYIVIGIVLSLFVFLYLRNLNNYWLPFIISCLMTVMNLVSDVAIWNTFPFAFGLRDYKEIARHNALISSGGVILGSLLIPLLLSEFSLESLLVYIMIGLLICTGLMHYLVFLEQAPKTHTDIKSADSLKSPLFKKVLIFICFIIVIQELTQYVFKYEIAQNFSGNEIGKFQGYYFSVANLLALLIGLTTTNQLLKLFHINGLLFVTQGITLFACLTAIISPSLAAVTFLFATKHLFYFNYSTVSLELILNIMPSVLRSAAKFQIKANVNPICTVVTYFLLLILASFITTREILIIIAILLIPTFYYIYQIIKQYQRTLQEEAEFRRFNIINELSPANATFFSGIASRALKSEDDNMILFGLSLRDKIDLNQQLSWEVYQHLNNPNTIIRKAVIDIIRKLKDKKSMQPLQNRFEIENDREMKFWLLETLAAIDSENALKIARTEIKNEYSNVFLAAIDVLINFGREEERKFSINLLHNLARHSDPIYRKMAAYIMGKSHIYEFEEDLNQLTSDPDNGVRVVAQGSLIKIGSAVIPSILSQIKESKDPALLINMLAKIEGIEAENALLSLATTEDVRIHTILSKEINDRACKQPISSDLKNAAKIFALEEIDNIHFLKNMASKYLQKAINLEIKSRIDLAKKRCLYWISIATKPMSVNRLIPSLLDSEDTFRHKQTREKALELLELYMGNVTVFQQVLSILDEKQTFPTPIKSKYNDRWLNRVINSQTNPSQDEDMDLLAKVFTLRQIELFKSLSGETLLAIAEETKQVTFDEGETIFNEGDEPDGLYCISLGKVKIVRQGQVLNHLQTYGYFGELGLIDNMPRSASVIAETDCVLLLLEKNTFERITRDLPEVLWCVTQTILRYLRQNLKEL